MLVMSAWEATMAARVDTIKAGQIHPGGTELKNGFEYASGKRDMCAAWPIYAMRRHGKAKPSHDN